MLRVPIEQAEPGMSIALPVYNPQRQGGILLNTGFELNSAIITRLKGMSIDHVWVKYPGLEAVEQRVSPELLQRRAQLVPHVRNAFKQAECQTAAGIPFRDYVESVTALIEQLLAHPASAIYLDQTCEADEPLANHSLRVAFLCTLMGLKLDAYLISQRSRLHPQQAKQITNLGLGALLHDIGLPAAHDDRAARRNGPDDRFDDPQWRRHVVRGYELLGDRVDPTARAVVLHHHQHYDGSGFPRLKRGDGRVAGLEGTAIHIYARIACVADVFDRLRHGYDLSPPRTAVEAVGRMLQPPIVAWFDPVVLGAFLQVTPPYPPGSLVTLSDDRRVAVVMHHPDDPCRPSVQPLDASGDAEPIDLREQPDLHVAAVDGEAVRDWNFDPPQLATEPAMLG